MQEQLGKLLQQNGNTNTQCIFMNNIENIKNTPGTRGWSRLRERTLAVKSSRKSAFNQLSISFFFGSFQLCQNMPIPQAGEKQKAQKKKRKKQVKTMASFALSATTGGARKHAWTKISIREAPWGKPTQSWKHSNSGMDRHFQPKTGELDFSNF